MADKQVTLHQKIDNVDRTISVPERAVHVYEASGWKRLSAMKRSKQATEDAASEAVPSSPDSDQS